MKTLKNFLSSFLFLALFTIACKEDSMVPIGTDESQPNPIVEASVENLPGAAKITYTLPDDQNLLYVKAEFLLNDVTHEAKASYYKNYIIIEGFGDTAEREVKLYTVSRTEKHSTPLPVVIQPLPPAITDVVASLQAQETAGGIVTSFSNPTKANIVITILRWDEAALPAAEWVEVDKFYTGLESGKFSTRGLPPVLTKFGLFCRDRWGNHSDTVEVEITPIYEEKLDKTKIQYAKGRGYPVPQKPPLPKSGGLIKEPGNLTSWPFTRLFDDLTGNTGFHTNERQDIPIWMPIDLTVKAKISRYKFWQRNSGSDCGFCYSHGNPHEWELWGTNTPSNVDSWVLLDYRVMDKPSGLPLGQTNNDDKIAADAGHEFELDPNVPAVRYIAWKHIDNWGAIEGTTGFFHVAELDFWGQIEQ